MLILHFYGGIYFDLYMRNIVANFEKNLVICAYFI